MQTDAVSVRITAAAQSNNRQINTSASQLVVDDQRLRSWTLAYSGSLTQLSAPTSLATSPANSGSLTADTYYFYAVSAVNGINESTLASISAASTTTACKIINYAWSAVSGASS